jgi:hypothetical protein
VRSRLRTARADVPQAVPIALHGQGFPARAVSLLSARLLRASKLRRHGAGFAEKRCRMPPNRKLLFNIRISTEDEINGTVKGDV